MSGKVPARPKWWKNTYFWIAAILVVVGAIGLTSGQEVIRDPGQADEDHLVLIYFVGAVVMLVNGLLSHGQTVQHYREAIGAEK